MAKGSFVAVRNFKDGERHNWKWYKIGEDYDGENVEFHVKHGNVVDKATSIEAKVASMQVEVKKKQAEIEKLEQQMSVLRNPVNLKEEKPKKEKSEKA